MLSLRGTRVLSYGTRQGIWSRSLLQAQATAFGSTVPKYLGYNSPPQDRIFRPLASQSLRTFISWRRIPNGFTYSIIDEFADMVNANPDVVMLTYDRAIPEFEKWKNDCEDPEFFLNQDGHTISDWHVEAHNASELHSFPTKIPHSGSYEWIGGETTSPPKWLWDSKNKKTVRTTQAILNEGYVAVSYTWGRWRIRDQWRRIPGVPWDVPVVESGHGDVEDMIPILSDIPGARYFWVDVLCINQKDEREKRQEIGKQGSIFKTAKAILIWAWSIPGRQELGLTLVNLGTCLMMNMRVDTKSTIELYSSCAKSVTYKFSEGETRQNPGTFWAQQVFFQEPWFTSLWTLQEMILCPSGLLMAKTGEYCEINKKPVTTAFIAGTVQLIKVLVDVRENLLMSYSLRHWLFSLAFRWKYGDDKFYERWLIARKAIKKGRWGLKNAAISGRTEQWLKWEETCSLAASLDADRLTILRAVTRRSSTSRRGQAILAALKVAPYDEIFEPHAPTPSGLPPSLLQKVFEVEGARMLFSMDDSMAGDAFFANILTNESATNRSMGSLTSLETSWFENEKWHIRADGALFIPRGSMLHAPEDASVTIYLTDASHIYLADFAQAPESVESKYQDWLHRSPQIAALKASFKEKVMSLTNIYTPSSTGRIDSEVPETIQVQFLPIMRAYEPEDIKELTRQALEIPGSATVYKTLGLRTDMDDMVFGLVLAAEKGAVGEKERRWYKCGIYVSKGNVKLCPIPEDIIVGQVF